MGHVEEAGGGAAVDGGQSMIESLYEWHHFATVLDVEIVQPVFFSSVVLAAVAKGFGSGSRLLGWWSTGQKEAPQVRVSALPASGRPYDHWRPHTCARLASRVGSAMSAGQLSEACRRGDRATICHIILPPPREDLLEVPDEGAEDEVLCLAAWPVVALG
ncbi:hypothetical protein BHE74_00037886 [Ensete ventricosum]|nr:hypothetical protein BHE74_00037886 [Ensete ventricosum]